MMPIQSADGGSTFTRNEPESAHAPYTCSPGEVIPNREKSGETREACSAQTHTGKDKTVESTHTVVARFEQQHDARGAMLDLELKGIDADAINLVPSAPLPTNEQVLEADVDVGGQLARYSARGALGGALIGAAVMALVLIAVGVRPLTTSVAVGLLTGAVGGAFIGGYWGLAKKLPVNEDALDTFVLDLRNESSGVLVEVTVGDPQVAADAVAVMRRHHARRIDREAH